MLPEIKTFVKTHFNDIMLVIVVVLLCLLSFAVGFLSARHQEKEPIKFEMNNNYVAKPQ